MSPRQQLLTLMALLQLNDRAIARRARIEGRQLFVNEKPFAVRGICYSPTPINESVYFAPYGDYFTAEYSFIWLRDLPLIKAMGANVVRIYGWQPQNDHTAFLDAVQSAGLYLMATYYMGEETESQVGSAAKRAAVVHGFKQEVAKYADHPSLLFWSFGNELNGVWNGYLQALSKSKGDEDCGWDERYDDKGGCWIHTGPVPNETSPCYDTSFCVYKRLFSFIHDAATAAKDVADVLVVSAFADVDGLYDKAERAGQYAEAMDAWTAQVYRGDTFGNFFEQFGNSTQKPVLLTEYGVDAYHDVCGAGGPLSTKPCYNTFGDKSGSHEDERAQAAFARNLTLEIARSSSHRSECKNAGKGTPNGDCTCLGGFLMSWTDEYWKGAKSQAACTPTWGSRGFSPKKCDPHAHITCGNWDASMHDLCGYWLEAAPDHYVNEEWFGITSPTQCADQIDALRPRQIFWLMRKLWSGKGVDSNLFDSTSCNGLIDGKCAALSSTSATAGWLPRLLFGPPRPPLVPNGTRATDIESAEAAADLVHEIDEAYDGDDGEGGDGRGGDGDGGESTESKTLLICSGRGRCTSDWRDCGAGSSSTVATPCCSCDWGFSGVGCDLLDVRVYIGVGWAAGLAFLVLIMIGSHLRKRMCGRRHTDLTERLLS